uniref:Uncharacterized protein n=1 Tax=Glossina palpalis gambiensis TaxID=67801 RepID=A0A1B0B4B9_9MUSC
MLQCSCFLALNEVTYTTEKKPNLSVDTELRKHILADANPIKVLNHFGWHFSLTLTSTKHNASAFYNKCNLSIDTELRKHFFANANPIKVLNHFGWHFNLTLTSVKQILRNI